VLNTRCACCSLSRSVFLTQVFYILPNCLMCTGTLYANAYNHPCMTPEYISLRTCGEST
jgi:hypothetical protein